MAVYAVGPDGVGDAVPPLYTLTCSFSFESAASRYPLIAPPALELKKERIRTHPAASCER